MKKFLKVTVNGSSYDVVVEEVKEGEVSNISEVVSNPVVSTPSVAEPVKEEKVEKVEVPAPSKEGNIKVPAPMPGNIWKIKTTVGAQVKKHEVLLILEAMKMENEIVAPEDGVVTAILVKEGDTVEPGKIMVEMA